MQILENKNPNIEKLYTKIQEQFPPSEIKEKSVFEKIIKTSGCKIYDILYENKICGFFTFCELNNKTILIDYFAINKEFHSMGLGTKTFEKIKSDLPYNGCYLEVEHPDPNEINTIRRIKFYENLGAKEIKIPYIYPNKNGGLPMKLYFMPFKNNYIPTIEQTEKNIHLAFEKLHFDINNKNEIYNKIFASI